MNKPIDVVVFGATGFTGRLVAEVLTTRSAAGQGLAWAMAGRAKAEWLARVTRLQNGLLGFGPSRRLLARLMLPRPGQGPGRRQRAAGSDELLFIGQTADGRLLRATQHGDGDPGYGSTSKMIVEAALCLAQDIDRRHTPGGVWTAGAALGLTLLRRLEANAGLSFKLVD